MFKIEIISNYVCKHKKEHATRRTKFVLNNKQKKLNKRAK